MNLHGKATSFSNVAARATAEVISHRRCFFLVLKLTLGKRLTQKRSRLLAGLGDISPQYIDLDEHLLSFA